MRLRVLSPAQPKPTATQHPLPAPTTRHAKWEERDYATATSEQLVEHARTHWHDADVLCQVNIQFMSQRHPDSWSHLANEVHQIEMQLTVLIKGPSRTRKPDDSNVDAVVEWPHEAMAPQAVALAGDQFTYSKGLLSYMGYRVGKDATLTPERRHRILDYVIGGALPQVNDRQYMRTWGRPRSAARLRKLANVLATFARNARRKQGKNYSQAIAEWEADLAYLKKRHYSRRSRDWKWPKTGLAKRK